MRLVICNSKNWFHLSNKISQSCEILNIENKCDLTIKKLEEFTPDIIFFPHWSWIVKKEIFSRFTCILFHTSPLPYGRGGSPIQNLIIRGHKNTPVCALKMSEGIDNGPIYDKIKISLEGTLTEILKRVNNAVNELIGNLILSLPEPKPQIGEFYKFERLAHADNEIPLGVSLKEFYDRVRMLDHPDYPNAYIQFGDIFLEFFETSNDDGNVNCKVNISKKEDN